MKLMVRNEGKCPCGIEGKDGTVDHASGPLVLLRGTHHEENECIAACANHAPIYLQFDYRKVKNVFWRLSAGWLWDNKEGAAQANDSQ